MTAFHQTTRSAVRKAKPWDRLAYIIKALPAGLEQLAPDIQPPAGGRVLDFGCADVPYRRFFGGDVEYLAADLPGNPDANVFIAGDGTLPDVADASVDTILSTQVLEHVADPAVYLAECARVLKPGGRMLLSTHGFMVWHPDPVDLWRWTNEGLRKEVADHGFHIARFEGIMGLAASGLQLFQDGVLGKVPRRLRKPVVLGAAVADRAGRSRAVAEVEAPQRARLRDGRRAPPRDGRAAAC